ncbi:hypothetical protein V8Z80_16050 [Orrella sp. JC864]|uniref:hypothetical protein n=1 Tax=Orrella sp. JC864 TaxID=3120298 RepID=UPI00300B3B2F
MNIPNAIAGSGGIAGIDLAGMDLQTALLAVQSERTRLLDTQLKDQIEAVQRRNESIAMLNEVGTALNALRAQFASGSQPQDRLPDTAENRQGLANLAELAGKASLNPLFPPGSGDVPTRADVDSAVTRVKSLIDSNANSQQMDMLRLQSMNNKRNEAFDVMTNFIQKMQESRASIIGNMR